MSKTPEGRPSSADVKNNSEKLSSALRRMGRAAAKAAKKTWETMIGRDSGEQAKNTSDTIAPEAPVESGDTSPIAMSEEQLEGLRNTPEYPVYPKSSLPKFVTKPDGRQYPVYPEPSFPEFVTTPDGNRSPVESGNTPAALIEPPKPTPAALIEPPEPTPAALIEPPEPTPAALIEPPEPTPDELDRIKWNDYMRDAAAKRFVLVHPTTEEDLRKLESFGVDIYSRYSPEVVSRYKDENAIDKDMFSTTIPNVDKPKKDDNPEGLTPYEQAMRDKYLGYEHDDAEKTEMSPEEHKAAANLKIARERFAKASIAVESHFFKKFFGGKKRQAELEAATEQLKQCELKYMSLKFADKIEAAKQDPEKQAELAAEMAQAAFASMQETSRMTTDKYDNMLDDRGKFKKAAAKVGKWFNKGGKIAQWLKLGGAGFVVGTATGTFAGIAGWPITTAVGIVTKLGVAGATKQAVLEEHRGEDRIAADDRLETIDPSFEKAVANMKIGDAMERAVNVSVDNLKDVSIERRDALRKKVISSSGKYVVGFVLGGVVGSFINDWWANSAHATGPEGSADTTPQSGDDQIPQSGNKPLIDNPAAKTIGNSVNPDTPNFSSYDYPWNWAAEKFGDANAMDQLHNLADKAMADGHTVQWFDGPGGPWLKVDESSATEHVLGVLSRYV
ncbi:hypothetical protein LRM49_03075 [Candidatus Nanosynbacter sp. HMT-352]|uniref:hypothetical protein n=1 Tax=Candidatus Nanosynbacter sp. HMT-352 TaxID=2899133 RepID=UPI001FB83949|nr:hypothetical protein [Candidatus Nanosynbacter sp. HMT-352]UOG67030.1 hypothetical protein LRM49_03075 [Candidatus Nanosynbacter sp. HMT-352]